MVLFRTLALLSISFSCVGSLAFNTATSCSPTRAFTVPDGGAAAGRKGPTWRHEDADGVGATTLLKTATMTENPLTISIVDLYNPDVSLKARRLRRPRKQRLESIDREQRLRDAEEKFMMGQRMAQVAVQEVYQEYNIKDVRSVARSATRTAVAASEEKFSVGQEAARKAVQEVFKEYNIKDVQTVARSPATAAAPASSRRRREAGIRAALKVGIRAAVQEEEIEKVVKGWLAKKAPVLHHCLREQKFRLYKGLQELRTLVATGI